MRIRTRLATMILCLAGAGPVAAQTCEQPRFSDPGWTDISVTTALTSTVLEGLGYRPETLMLGLDITYLSLKNGDLDVFLGSWIPGLSQFSDPYYADGSVETVAVNLTGAKFTWAVPRYVYEAGVTSFADLAEHKERFGGRIYGVEPGGNRHIESVLEQNAFGLGDWELVESSEAGMLAQVRRAVNENEWIVFLGWAPHPMNRNFDIEYLADGDEFYGTDYGASYVNTDVRTGYLDECPKIAPLLRNLKFDIDMENELMDYVLGDGMSPPEAAVRWLKDNPDWLSATLAGVGTLDGEDGLAAVRAHLGID